ncbi:MAG: Asp-tRNA(Asn)/Glu-tRNA(Gln) amidotransferase subunit GatC [Candidatus Berkelbacteria bacterium]
MSNISNADVEHVARLARLKLTDEEKNKFTHELGEVLNYIDEINETDTAQIEAVSQISGLSSITRSDDVTNSSNREKLLINAPAQHDGAIKVKQVFE